MAKRNKILDEISIVGSCRRNPSSLPSQNKHLHEQMKTVESIGLWHLLHDTGNQWRPVPVLFTGDKLDAIELGVVAIERGFEVEDAKLYDIVFIRFDFGATRRIRCFRLILVFVKVECDNFASFQCNCRLKIITILLFTSCMSF